MTESNSNKPAGMESSEQEAMGIAFLLSLVFTIVGGYALYQSYPESGKPEYWIVFVSSLVTLVSLVHVNTRMIGSVIGFLQILVGIVMAVSD